MSQTPEKNSVAFLTLRNISKTFANGSGGSVPAVSGITLSMEKGEFVTILGPSGCGKTTTLRIAGGLETPDTGDIVLNGKRVNDLPPQERNMPLVFQSYALFPHMDVYDNIAYGLTPRGIPKEVVQNDVEMSLQLVNLVGLERRYPNTLSGGQQQRVALARALVLKPTVILFDEPLSNLDAKLRAEMRTEIRRIQKMLGITTLYVTHDQAEALSISDRVVIMNHGIIEQVGTPEEVYGNPKSLFVADFVGNANFIEAVIEEMTETTIIADIKGTHVQIARSCAREELSEDEEVYLTIKPEAVRLSENGARFTGRLTGRFFMGPSVEYEVEFDNVFLTSIQSGKEIPRCSVGSSVGIEFEPEHFRVFRKRRL